MIDWRIERQEGYLNKILLRPEFRRKKGFEVFAVSVILAILVIIFFWKVFFLGQAFLPADMVNMRNNPWMFDEKNIYQPYGRVYNPELSDPIFIYYPIKSYVQSAVNSGQLPLWNPLSFCGYTFTDRFFSEFLHPLDFLFLFIPATYAFGYSAAFHVFLAGLFMYLLARQLKISVYGSLFASVVFMFNANTVVWLQFPTHLKAELLIPLVFLFVIKYIQTRETRFAIAGGIVYGFQFLTGYSHCIQFTAIAVFLLLFVEFLYQLAEKRIKKHFTALVLNSFLFAVVSIMVGASFLVPFYDSFKESIRYFQPRTAGGGPVTFTYLITMAMPNFFGNNVYGKYWARWGNYTEVIRYSGVITLFLAVVGIVFKRTKYVFAFLLIAVVAVLTTSGTFVLDVLLKVIPFFAKSSIARILLLLPFSLALLSGFGFSVVEENLFSLINSYNSCAKKVKNTFIGFEHKLGRISYIINKKRNCMIAILLVFVALLSVAIYSYVEFPHHISLGKVGENSMARLETLSFILFFILLFGSIILLLWFLYSKGLRKKIAGTLILGFLVLDLFIFGINYNPTSPPDQVYFKTPSIELVKQDEGKYRVLGMVAGALPPDTMWVYGLEDPAGYDPILSNRYAYMWRTIQGNEMVRINGKIGADNLNENFLKLFNIKYIFSKSQISSRGYFVDNFDKAKVESKQDAENIVVDMYERQGYMNPSIITQPSSKITYDYFVPKGEQELVFFTYLDDGYWNSEKGDGVEFRVVVEMSSDKHGDSGIGTEDLIFSQVIDPINNPDHRRMYFNSVDITQYSGKHISVSFITDERGDPENELPVWGNPKIIPKGSYGYDILTLLYNDEVLVYRYEDYLDRAFLVHNSKIMNEDEILPVIFDTEKFNPSDQVLLEKGEEISYSINSQNYEEVVSEDEVKIVDYGYNKIKINTNSSLDSYLVLLDSYDENWRVFVDGIEREILRANYNFRAVFLEKGKHVVEFIYFPLKFYISLGISLGAIILAAAAIVVLSKKNRKNINFTNSELEISRVKNIEQKMKVEK